MFLLKYVLNSDCYTKVNPMAANEFATYGYKIDNRMNLLVGVSIAAVFLAIPLSAGLSGWFLLLLLVPAGAIIYAKRSGMTRPLVIATRYLILGERIVYYRNVTRAALDRERQVLTISPARGPALTISADKFPTNARKPDKIKANRSAKFVKVADRIVERLRAASPDIVIT